MSRTVKVPEVRNRCSCWKTFTRGILPSAAAGGRTNRSRAALRPSRQRSFSGATHVAAFAAANVRGAVTKQLPATRAHFVGLAVLVADRRAVSSKDASEPLHLIPFAFRRRSSASMLYPSGRKVQHEL